MFINYTHINISFLSSPKYYGYSIFSHSGVQFEKSILRYLFVLKIDRPIIDIISN